MKKKVYIQPEIEILEIELEGMMAASTNLTSNGTYDDTDGNGMTLGSPTRRTLWEEE